jgi:restriction system protein
MKQYKRIMLGANSVFSKQCYEGGFIGADFISDIDMTNNLPEKWREFNIAFRPIWLKSHPGKSKIAAGLACGMLWTICKGIKTGDIVLCPTGEGRYYVGEITSNYYYQSKTDLPHRRKVNWYSSLIDRSDMSDALRNSTGSIGTVSDITKYSEEIEILLKGKKPPMIFSNDEAVEDASAFALEKHLEDFLVKNWGSTELGNDYDIYEENGELVGQQYQSDTGPIDILAISKDKKTILVVELKKGRVSDNVVGQIQRYMGYVKEELAEDNQNVKGIIIGLEDNLKIKRALSVTSNIEFYRYRVNFKLFKG